MKNCPRCGYSPSGKSRSDQQNKYYWGCVVQILSDELGYTQEEVHEIIKDKFLCVRVPLKNPKGLEIFGWIKKSTTSLDTKEWEEFMTKIREWASQVLGIWIPEPNEPTKGE
jgi:hypothetical protein